MIRISAETKKDNPASAIGRSKRAGGADHESESNAGLYRMQAPQLCNEEEQA